MCGGFLAGKAVAASDFVSDFNRLESHLALSNQANMAEDRAAAQEREAEALYRADRLNEAMGLLQALDLEYATIGDNLARARVLINIALVYYQKGETSMAASTIDRSIQFFCDGSNNCEDKIVNNATENLWADIIYLKGEIETNTGQLEGALESWKAAAQHYANIGDMRSVIKSKIAQAQAMMGLGLYRNALDTLAAVNSDLEKQPNTLLKAIGLKSLGDALRVLGQLEKSQEVLGISLEVAQQLNSPEMVASVLISLGNTARSNDVDAALGFYAQAIATCDQAKCGDSLVPIEGRLNQINLLRKNLDKMLLTSPDLSQKITNLITESQGILQILPPSRMRINAEINFARSLIALKDSNRVEISPELLAPESIAYQLAKTVISAQTLGDKRGESYALGNLGRLYKLNEMWDDARKLTEQALLIAQQLEAGDIAYQWQWQLGRILKFQGDREGAIVYYQAAIKTLDSLRGDLVAVSSEVQFDFKESVEPVYREFVSLLLAAEKPPEPSELILARNTIESLQLAELDNFFRDACLNKKPQVQIDQIDQKAAVFYPIILENSLEVILALPGGNLRHYRLSLAETEIETIIQQLRDALTIPRLQISRSFFLRPSQQIYDWLIRPAEQDLAASGVETLVFVLDGALRNVPMTSLYDGKQYLIEKYSVALAPGLELVDSKPIARQELKILTAGLTEGRQGFSPLPGVEWEIEQIEAEAPTQVLLNQSFTQGNLKAAVDSFPFQIVHLATHGKFSSQAEDTFVLTWDGRLNAKELDSLLRGDSQQHPIELLVLSACNTAAGDNRAALGLAGVAVRAGARSTLASLWYVSDEATAALMSAFYRQLAKPGVTKAEALRLAQVEVLQQKQFAHPYFWSAFVLVGNWL
ncbi:MAG TPA: CHAT domain-containing protein [Oscillatoriaceae cyanobacterium M33_DOE_052]|uniref:CHAT domain-containing protein n=1 Tax=Planktothricoides sp. SpSt-374 TaxID=2282167 RepID=A0A7C3ZJI0_9CYAN|nr:CHAT domain-containing protein [Oscillatoriaceae cyanobacterium M33_DOE_052]